MMDATTLGEKCEPLKKDARVEWARLATLQRKIDGGLVTTWTPDNADLEYKDLLRKASSPWLGFARDVIAQGCRIDGYDDAEVWQRAWQANGMDGRQPAINREAIGLGKSFILCQPSDDDGVVMRPLSALNTFAVYEDLLDEYPVQVLARVGRRKPGQFWNSTWLYIDQEAVYRFTGDPARPENLTVAEHGLDVCPVVLIPNTLSLDGEPRSSIEPAVPVYQRIVDATFTLEMLQRYGAFPQKWMAGGEIAKNEDGTPTVRSSVDSLLHASGVSGETARFGTFEAADLTKAVAALVQHITDMCAVLQVPTLYFLGPQPNTSADSIVAGEASYHRNLADRRLSLGEGYELALRTAALILGLDGAAADTSSQVHWDDVATYTLNQVSDSVVKLAAVGAPLEMLFAMIPGWTKQDVLEAAGEVRARQAQAAITAPPAA